ncbi:DUF4179 domain-containing protein [Bacillus sp. BRMEA1]|uniref:DUF4179 domain-containing protein n=1 Tax=Neobacillus endophyticus TaxID=2738405 RepID=UPI0015642198|nr:DUF4179 domain-containing protein [Neobacillus endophyticus]NRD81120.1 DUF4179 domain-containing protein [Neobacillus endophyticus]
MDKQQFNDEINKIEVPQPDLHMAIKKGISKAQKEKPAIRKIKRFSIPLIASSLVIVFFGSGFVSPQMSRVFADVPIIGKMYSSFNDSVGQNLAASKLVTELNDRAVSNGVGVTVNGVYYDSGRISVTFKVDHLSLQSNDFLYDVKIADGSDKWNRGAQYGGRVTPDGCFGQILIDYPDKSLPEHVTLPLTFTAFNDVKGKWKFDIPIRQLDNKKIHIVQSVQSDDKELKMNFESLTIGKGSATLDYKAIYSLVGKDDMARIDKVTDDKGHKIDVLSSGTEFGRKRVGNSIESEERSIIGKIPENAKYMKIYPHIQYSESFVSHPLEKNSFEMKSKRGDATLKVDQIQQSKRNLIVKYTLDHVDTKHLTFDFQNFGEIMKLTDSAEIGKDRPTIGHFVKGSTIKVLDSDKLQFQASFKLDGEFGIYNFSLEHYSLEAPFSMLLPEKTLPPLTIYLK